MKVPHLPTFIRGRIVEVIIVRFLIPKLRLASAGC
jgi:hypothetical protein